MKKFIHSLILLALLLGSWAASAPAAQAQEATPPAAIDDGIISLAQLGQADMLLRGPFDSNDVRFTPPGSWLLKPDASLLLKVNPSFAAGTTTVSQGSGASIQVSLNDVLLTTIFISQTGVQTFLVPIPPEALVSTRSDGRHVLRFFLDASTDCRFDHETSVVIQSDSLLSLPHDLISPSTDLSLLPRPIFQGDSFLPETALLVVPDQPTAQELQAAMTVEAGFGRMTSGNLALPLVTAGSLTEEQKASNHLVVVGKPAGLGLISGVNFVSPVVASGVNDPQVQPEDGVVEMAVSPWNQGRVVLYVGGNSDAGVVKAAQALSFGVLQPGSQPSQTVIGAVNTTPAQTTVAADRTLTDLGYQVRSISGYGTSSLEYHFFIPAGQVPGGESFFNLIYTHSALLDPGRSGLVVALNDRRIGSALLTEDSASQVNSLKVALPAEVLRPGDNKLVVQVDMRPRDFCSNFMTDSLWFTVDPSSLVHMPLVPAEAGIFSLLADLSLYPYPFSADPTLGNVGFVLTDAASWNVAAQIAAGLGRRATGQILAPGVALANSIPDGFTRQHDLIVIGRASAIPLLAELADSMPAPFEAGSDQATERSLPVTYRLPAGTSLGYIEVFPSPWDAKHTVLTVLGSTDEGLAWAADALLITSLRSKLSGNFAVINRTQIQSADTRVGFTSNLSATAVPGAQAVQAQAPAVPQATARPVWLLPTLVFSGLLLAGLIAFLVVNALRKSKQTFTVKRESDKENESE
jgi:hypothetical protein